MPLPALGETIRLRFSKQTALRRSDIHNVSTEVVLFLRPVTISTCRPRPAVAKSSPRQANSLQVIIINPVRGHLAASIARATVRNANSRPSIRRRVDNTTRQCVPIVVIDCREIDRERYSVPAARCGRSRPRKTGGKSRKRTATLSRRGALNWHHVGGHGGFGDFCARPGVTGRPIQRGQRSSVKSETSRPASYRTRARASGSTEPRSSSDIRFF